jgi:hypothetical protein
MKFLGTVHAHERWPKLHPQIDLEEHNQRAQIEFTMQAADAPAREELLQQLMLGLMPELEPSEAGVDDDELRRVLVVMLKRQDIYDCYDKVCNFAVAYLLNHEDVPHLKQMTFAANPDAWLRAGIAGALASFASEYLNLFPGAESLLLCSILAA